MGHDNSSSLYKMHEVMKKGILSIMFRLKAIPMHVLILRCNTETNLAHKISKNDLQFLITSLLEYWSSTVN